MDINSCLVFQDGASSAGELLSMYTLFDVKSLCCKLLHTQCRGMRVYHALYACGDKFGIVECVATFSTRHGDLQRCVFQDGVSAAGH